MHIIYGLIILGLFSHLVMLTIYYARLRTEFLCLMDNIEILPDEEDVVDETT